jgi:hypothetical protein
MATEFICKIRASGGDYTTLAAWQTAMTATYYSVSGGALTNARVRVYSHSGIYEDMADGTTAVGTASGREYTAAVIHRTASQIALLHDTADEQFHVGDTVQTEADHYVVISGAADHGDTIIQVAEVECSDGNAYTGAVSITGWTTGADNPVIIRSVGTYRHSGVWPTSGNIARFDVSEDNAITIGNSQYNIKLRGLAVRVSGTGSALKCITVGTGRTNDLEISGCVLVNDGSTVGTTLHCIFSNNSSATGVVIANNICMNSLGYGILWYGANSGASILNNTVVKCRAGIRCLASTGVVLINNISPTYQVGTSWGATSGYNTIYATPVAGTAFGTTKATGTTTSDTTGHLVCSTATFGTAGVVVGQIVANTTTPAYSWVKDVTETDLTLATDIFANAEAFAVYTNKRVALIGTSTSDSTNNLVSSAGDFVNNGVAAGNVVVNTFTWATATVNTVTNANTLALSADIFGSNEGYLIYTQLLPGIAFEDFDNGDFHLSASDTMAKECGVNLYSATPAITVDIDGGARPSAGAFDIGADQSPAEPSYATESGSGTLPAVTASGNAYRTIFPSGSGTLGAITGSGNARREFYPTGSGTIGAVTASNGSVLVGRRASGTGSLPAVTAAGGVLCAPTGLYCADADAQAGATNPVNILDLTPHFSCVVGILDSNITDLQIQVSAEGDDDWSDPVAYDSGWVTLDEPETSAGRVVQDLVYGEVV